MSPPRRGKFPSWSWVAVALALAAGIASCKPPRSRHPLTDPIKAKADVRLAGLWAGQMHAGDPATLQFVPRDGASVDVVLVGRDKKLGAVVLAFEAFPSSVGGRRYLNLRAKTFRGEYAEDVDLAPEYIFAKYEIGKDGALTLWSMIEDPAVDAIKAGTLKGSTDAGTTITDESEKVAEFVRTADHSRLFSHLGTFRKVAPAGTSKPPAKPSP